MRFINILIFSLCCLFTCTVRSAVEQHPQSKTADEISIARLRLDTEQAAFNRQLEQEKLAMEKTKAWITGASLMVPLMVAALTLALGVWNQNEQARLQREVQEKTERSDFELKAAEIVMNEKGPVGAGNKARALKALFPKKLPEDFVKSFNPDEFEGPKTESIEAKKAFFQAAASKETDVRILAALWKQLFPGEKWPERLIDLAGNSIPPSSKV